MGQERIWNDESRNSLREKIKSGILGSLRLAKLEHHEIVALCREDIKDKCPDREWDMFIHFVSEEINRATARLASERDTWPAETDCDRLDRVESALRDQGILLWQASPCCDTCSGASIPARIDEIHQRDPGFQDRVRGYAFFNEQNLPESLSEDTRLSVYLAYGWHSQDDSNVPDEVYNERALGIAREVCKAMSDEGFEPDWNGNIKNKICISVNWQRRTMLT